MAHQIYSNDRVVMAGQGAWHGLGIVLPEQFTPADALRIGGLDWSVEESTALTATFAEANGEATRNIVETHKTLRRSDDKSILGTVGAGYSPVQNSTLAEIANAFNSTGQVRCETAGSLFGGKRVWFLLDAGTVEVGKRGDQVARYVMIHNTNDGTASLGGDAVNKRVVCNNTYTGALREGGSFFRFRHTSGIGLRVEDAKQALAAYWVQSRNDEAAMQAMAAKPLTRQQIQSLWTDVLIAMDGPIATNPKTESEQRRREKAIGELAYMSKVFDRESADFGANAWVAANAITNYIEHERGRLKGEGRVSANLFGSYNDHKRTAFRKALELV